MQLAEMTPEDVGRLARLHAAETTPQTWHATTEDVASLFAHGCVEVCPRTGTVRLTPVGRLEHELQKLRTLREALRR